MRHMQVFKGTRLMLVFIVVAAFVLLASVSCVSRDPPLPVMRLRHAGQVYDGVEGGYSWPGRYGIVISGGKVSGETLGAPIPVDTGDNVTIEI